MINILVNDSFVFMNIFHFLPEVCAAALSGGDWTDTNSQWRTLGLPLFWSKRFGDTVYKCKQLATDIFSAILYFLIYNYFLKN